MNSENSNSFVLQAVVFEGAMALIGALLALLCGLDLWKAFRVPDIGALFGQLGLGIAIAVGLIIVFTAMDYIPWSHLKKVSQKTKDVLCDMLKTSSRFNRFLVCFLAGIGEEILFRGFVFVAIFEFWPWGLEYNLNIIAAVIVSSVLFGFGHYVTLLYFIITGLLGVAFCLVFLWTGSLIAPVVAHVLYDFYAMETALNEDEA